GWAGARIAAARVSTAGARSVPPRRGAAALTCGRRRMALPRRRVRAPRRHLYVRLRTRSLARAVRRDGLVERPAAVPAALPRLAERRAADLSRHAGRGRRSRARTRRERQLAAGRDARRGRR